ncbi:IS3 family transposase [Roseomonas mucosa]|nr:IS3 family transposase [Roseomonas mucosa]MDT8315431.1 IS3 family transposase [Roseomonas mucosa]MDT8361692.1 IS3 family transposase [Roseomonas mucosa]
MARKKAHTPEEIVAKLRQAEVLIGQGRTVADAVRAIGVTEPTYYRWRTEFGGLKLDQVKRLKELERENARLRKAVSDLTLEKVILKEAASGKLVSPARRRACVEHVVRELGVSERRACAVLGQHRSTQRKAPRGADDEAALTADIVELAKRYGRYGYRRITALLRDAGWSVNRKRVERIWRREGLKVPQRQPKRGRLWLADGSCVRLRPERANHVWAYDFVEDRTREGRKFRMLCVVDEYTREALAIRVARKLTSADVIDTMADLFVARGTPAHIRSDQGPEFVAEAVKGWIEGVGARTAYIEKASPWENGYVESFNGKLRDELLNGEVFNTLREAQVLIEGWRRHYNQVRPHSSLRYRPPTPETVPAARSQISSGTGAAATAH